MPEVTANIDRLKKESTKFGHRDNVGKTFSDNIPVIYDTFIWLAEHQQFLAWLLDRKKKLETSVHVPLWTGDDDQLTKLYNGLAGWAVKSDLETFRQAFISTEANGTFIDWIEDTRLLGYLLTMLCNVERLIPSNFAKLIGDANLIKSKKGEFLKTNNLHQVTHQVNELKNYAKPKGSEKIDTLLESLRV